MNSTLRVGLGALLLAGPGLSQAPQIPADGPSIYTVRSGLKYSVLQAGQDKARPGLGDRVSFHYSAWLTDGKLVETTRLREKPLVLTLGVAMPKAWVEGLPLMTAGSRFKFTAPPHLAYDKTGTPGRPPGVPPVPPNATVVFEMELVSFEKGIVLPEFQIPNPKHQKVTASGLKFETLKSVRGAQPKTGERFTVKYVLFNARGQLVATSRSPEDRPIVGRLGGPLPGPKFLPEAIGMLRLGEKIRFVVPASLAWGKTGNGYLVPPGTETIWEMQLEKIEPAPAPRAAPEFARLHRAKLQRTASGLRYEVIKAGTGRRPKPTDSLEIHYAGWLSTKRCFEETLSKGIPLRIATSDLVPGLAEGIRLMTVGSVFRFAVPAELGYGLRGRKDLKIGPSRRLYYYVELVSISDNQR